MSARLVARSAAASWRLVVGPRTPVSWVQGVRPSVVVTADDDDLPPPELAAVAAEVWASSIQAAEELRRAGWSGEAKLVPFLGPPADLSPTPTSTRSAQPWRLLCTARPTWRSGVEDLLVAVAELNRAGDATLLRLVDDGTDATVAARFTASRLGLGDLVEFGSLGSFEELAAWLDWAHAFVLPAVDDGGWPETAEAQRAGLALIVTDQPSLQARLAGWPLADLVPARRPEGITAAVRSRLGEVHRPARLPPTGHPDVASPLVAG
jgi:glycosyltransferase involved in cell wall biosynthesis